MKGVDGSGDMHKEDLLQVAAKERRAFVIWIVFRTWEDQSQGLSLRL